VFVCVFMFGFFKVCCVCGVCVCISAGCEMCGCVYVWDL